MTTTTTDAHSCADYAVRTSFECAACHETIESCAMCGKELHICKLEKPMRPPLPRGFVKIPEFPDFMINKFGTVQHIRTKRLCVFVRLTSSGGAMINISRNGKPYTRAVQALRAQAFPEQETN